MGRSEIRGGQIKDDSITGEDVDESTLILDTLRDADGDTKVQVEASADEDKIRFITGGNQRMMLRNSDESVAVCDNNVGDFTPKALLHVSGAGSGGDQLFIVGGGSSNKPNALVVDQNGHVGVGNFTGNAANPLLNLSVSGSFGIYEEGDGAGLNSQTKYLLNTFAGSGHNTTWKIGSSYHNDTTHKFRIAVSNTNILQIIEGASANTIRINGDSTVGIGTTGADRKLDVLDASNPQLRLTQTNGTNYADFKGTSAGDLEISPSGENPHVKIIGDENTALIVQSDDSNATGNVDATIGFSVNAGTNIQWSLGCDNSDSDKFKIGTSLIETDTRLTIDSTGNVGIGTDSPLSLLHVNGDVDFQGGQKAKFRDVNSTSSLLSTDYVIRAIQGGAITLTLPAKASSSGQVIIIKDALRTAATNNITIQGDGSPPDTIDGGASFIISSNGGCVTVMCDGISGWMVIGDS